MRFLGYILGALYFIAPIDLIPDYLGPIGRIDDLLFIVGLIYYFRKRHGQFQSFSANFKSGNDSNSNNSSSNLSKQDPFGILEIAQGSSKEEVTKQYKKLMSQYHPDKVAHLGDDLKKLAQEKTLQIQAAYEKLNEK